MSGWYYERLACAPGSETPRAPDAYALSLQLSASRINGGRFEYRYHPKTFYEPTTVTGLPGAARATPEFYPRPYRGVLPLSAQPVIDRPFPFEERHAGV